MHRSLKMMATATSVAIAIALLPAAAATAAGDESSGVDVEVEGRSVAVVGDPVMLTLPGALTSDEVDAAHAPDEKFNGEGDPVLSTSVEGAVISSFATANGTQTLIEIPSSAAPDEYRFPLTIPDGGEASIVSDGSVAIFDANGESLGGFKAPWAVDANGAAVPTSFRLEGNILVQQVEITETTAFPVIADPERGSEWWGVWYRYSKAETKSIASGLQSSNATMIKDFIMTACAFAGWGAPACAAYVQVKWYSTMQPAINAYKQGKCFALNIPYFVSGATMNGTIVNCTR